MTRVPRTVEVNSGPFAAQLSGHALLDAVAAIVRHGSASPDLEPAISMRAYGRARAELGRTDVPGADALRQRLSRPWPLIVRLALASASERGRILGQSLTPAEGLGSEELDLAGLRSIVQEAGGLPSMDAYDLLVDERNEERQRRRLAPLPLACAQTLIARHGSWKAALEAAGLSPDSTPSAARARRESRFRPSEEILDELIDLIGVLPGRRYLEQFGAAWDIPLRAKELKSDWTGVVERTRVRRAAADKWTPAEPTPPRRCPPIPEPPASTGPRRRKARRHTPQTVLESLQLYGQRHLRSGQLPSERHYRACAERDDQLVAIHSATFGLTFGELCQKAGL